VSLPPGRTAKVIRAIIWALSSLVLILVVPVGVTAVLPTRCIGCHTSNAFVQGTATSAHAGLSCDSCHAGSTAGSRLAFASSEVYGMVLGLSAPRERANAAVPDATCLACHGDVLKGVVGDSGLRILHSKCAKDLSCSGCHSSTAHGTATKWLRTAQMDQCLKCHSTDEVSVACDLCHSAKRENNRISSGSWAVIHGANWETTHGMGDWDTCRACHDAAYCAGCHRMPLPHPADFLRTHSTPAQADLAACRTCHDARFCDDCHGVPMPHPAGFTPSHAGLVKSKGKTACLRCHKSEDCAACHAKHVHPGGATAPPGGAQ